MLVIRVRSPANLFLFLFLTSYAGDFDGDHLGTTRLETLVYCRGIPHTRKPPEPCKFQGLLFLGYSQIVFTAVRASEGLADPGNVLP